MPSWAAGDPESHDPREPAGDVDAALRKRFTDRAEAIVAAGAKRFGEFTALHLSMQTWHPFLEVAQHIAIAEPAVAVVSYGDSNRNWWRGCSGPTSVSVTVTVIKWISKSSSCLCAFVVNMLSAF